MKTKILKHSLIFIFFISAFSISCSSNDDNAPNQSKNSFFCKVDGIDFTPQFVDGFNTAISNTIVLSANSNKSATETTGVQIFVPNNIPVGTYTLDIVHDPNADYYTFANYYTPNDEAENSGFSASGVLKISEHNTENKTIKGSFNFVTKPTPATSAVYKITEGSFSISYNGI